MISSNEGAKLMGSKPKDKRSSLRTVSVTNPKHSYKGYFHGFMQEGNLEFGIEPIALIETESGKINQEPTAYVKFTDVN